jgi:hypothetical protein
MKKELKNKLTRRDFVKVSGAALLLSILGGCTAKTATTTLLSTLTTTQTITGETITETVTNTITKTATSTITASSSTNPSTTSSTPLTSSTSSTSTSTRLTTKTTSSVTTPVGGGDDVTGTAVYSLSSGIATKTGETITASEDDQSAIIVSNGANLTLKDMTISTSGNTSSMDNASFYGLNAAILAQAGSTIYISDTEIETTGTGANGVFACGSGAYIDLKNVTINCIASGAHGVDATVAGVLTMTNVDITTAGDGAAAAIATDRGGGTITATGGTVVTTGTKSPAIYSTGNITVSDAEMQCTNSEAVVIEGANSVTVNNCIMSTTKNYGAFIYQSMSGDAEVGTANFTMNGGSLTAGEGPMFYSTNTIGVINLNNATLNFASGILLQENADQWGTSGSNGSDITLIADTQMLEGDIVLDNISTADITLKNNSTLEGAINTGNTAQSVSLTLDASSTWTLTANSYLTSLNDADTTLSNINTNGYTVYYGSKSYS